ncbi:MAG: hypothetical protein HY862_01410 [Chloroflexi bacterium]|nr:hypothetical protein [Chloroflexota bacterium]
MEATLQNLHEGLNNAYIMFCFLLGIYAAWLGGTNKPLSGNYWGAMWIDTMLAVMVLVVAILLSISGVNPKRVITYYLYAVYFVISMPGLFAAMQGSDSRRAAYFFGILGVFNAAAAYRAETVLVLPWHH